MTLFWVGVSIFVIGALVRYYYKFKYYKDYKNNAHTDLQRGEMRDKYRPLVFVALAIEVIGCIITFISLWG